MQSDLKITDFKNFYSWAIFLKVKQAIEQWFPTVCIFGQATKNCKK